MSTRSVLLAALALALASTPCQLPAQERAPAQAEYDLLAAIAGEYTYEYTEVGSPMLTGRIVFESFADGQFLKFEETFGEDMGIIGIVGYDSIGGYFTWYRVFENGAYDHARGELEDGTITFDITESRWEPWGEDSWAGPGIRLRTKWTDFSEDGFTFIWERSVNKGPWERLSEGRDMRVR